jgi:alpha-N-arabinofuranosidase
MGRETFLVPVIWEDGWPVASWQTGLVEQAYTIEGNVSKREIGDKNAVDFPKEDDFNSENLDMYWLGLRRIDKNYINCSENLGNLRLYGGSDFEGDNVSFIARRQTSFSFKAYAKLCANFNNDNDSAGLICFQNEKFYYKVQFKLTGKIVNIFISVDSEITVDSIKENADKFIKCFSESEIAYYDFQVFVTGEGDKYPMLGYKHKNSEGLFWNYEGGSSEE